MAKVLDSKVIDKKSAANAKQPIRKTQPAPSKGGSYPVKNGPSEAIDGYCDDDCSPKY